MAEYGVDISVRVKRDQVDQLGRLLDAVEKQVGKLNRVKVNLDASPANRALDGLINKLREAEQIANRFSGSNKIRSGIGAFSNSVGQLSKELSSLRAAFDDTKDAGTRQERALELLSAQFKKTRLEGQAFANASADFFDKGLGSLAQRIKEIEALPRNLYSSGEAIRELTYLQSLAVQGTEEWLTVSKALGRQLEINANIRLGAQRAQGPMPQDPFGTRQLLLPAAGQTSGTFEIVQRQAQAETAVTQTLSRRERVQQKIAQLKQLEAEQTERVERSERASINNATRQYQQDKKNIEQRRRAIASGVSSAAIGGAFPLLFGQGIGASIGGAIGGGAGAAFGGQGGFAGSLIGTFAGQATIDFAINSAVQLGTALRKPTQNIQELVKFLGIAGTELDANITVLQALGYESSASAIALAKLEETLSAEGYKNINVLSKELTELDNAFSRLKLAVAALAAGPLSRFFDDLADFIKFFARAGGVRGLITSSPEELQALDRQIKGERTAAKAAASKQNTAAEKAAAKLVTDEQNRQLNLAGAQVALERDRLALTRTGLAARQGDIELLRIGNDLEKKRVELTAARLAKLEKSKQIQLESDVKMLEQQRSQAEAAKQNAILLAEREVRKETRSLIAASYDQQVQYNNALVEAEKLTSGEVASLRLQLNYYDGQQKAATVINSLQRENALEGVNELDIRKKIVGQFDWLLNNEIQRIENQKEYTKQQIAEYKLGQLQIEQQRKLANLQAKTQFGLQLSNLKAQTDPRFFGLFGGSARTQETMLLEQQATLTTQRAQLVNLQNAAAVPGISFDRKQELEQDAAALRDQIAIYEQYQPAVINATVAQQKFNEALSLTKPVVDGVFDSIVAVAEGTKSAEQAFADFLMSIANMLFDTVKQMIAQYIALGIARQFAGIPAVGGLEPRTAQGNASFMDRIFSLDLAGSRALGGPVSAGRPYLVGESGPELFMPRSSGSIYPNDAMGMGGANIVVNVDAGGSSVGGDPGQASQLGKVIGLAVQQELIKQKRPGGLLA